MLTEYFSAVVAPLLKHPVTLTVKVTHDDMGVLLTAELHPSDIGLVIGRSGETAKAIRHLVRIHGLINNARVSIKFAEPVTHNEN